VGTEWRGRQARLPLTVRAPTVARKVAVQRTTRSPEPQFSPAEVSPPGQRSAFHPHDDRLTRIGGHAEVGGAAGPVPIVELDPVVAASEAPYERLRDVGEHGEQQRAIAVQRDGREAPALRTWTGEHEA